MDDKAMRVLIADDRSQVRSALRLLLKQEPDIIVVGETGDVEQTLELVGARPAH